MSYDPHDDTIANTVELRRMMAEADKPEPERPRIVVVGSVPGSAMAAATVAALEGAGLSVFRQSGGQVAEALAMIDARKGILIADVIALLDDPRIAGAVRVPGETADRILFGSPDRERERGLFTRKPRNEGWRDLSKPIDTAPLPPSTMTRQQRRYLARKGRTND